MLIRKYLTFKLLDVKLDPGGRYVLVHAIIDTFEMLIVGLYIPPPATTSLLKALVPIMSTYATDNIIVAGDFNMLLSPSLDKLVTSTAVGSPLSCWASLYILMDVWQWKHPDEHAFTCHSATHHTLSRIELIYTSPGLLLRVSKVEMLP